MPKYRIRIRMLRNGGISADVIDTAPSNFKIIDLLPWAAFLISIISLLFSISQGIESREHDRLSVTPYLHMERFGEMESTFGISVQNNGVGPAVIDKLEILYDGKPIYSIPQLYRNLLLDIPNITKGTLTYTEVISGEYYRAGQIFHIIEGKYMDSDTQKAVWKQLSTNLEIKLYYCSAYKECTVECLIKSKDECEKFSLSPAAGFQKRGSRLFGEGLCEVPFGSNLLDAGGRASATLKEAKEILQNRAIVTFAEATMTDYCLPLVAGRAGWAEHREAHQFGVSAEAMGFAALSHPTALLRSATTASSRSRSPGPSRISTSLASPTMTQTPPQGNLLYHSDHYKDPPPLISQMFYHSE